MLLLRSIADSLPGTYAAGATHHAWGHLCSPLPSFGFCFDVPQVVSSLDAFLAIRALPLARARVHLSRSLSLNYSCDTRSVHPLVQPSALAIR
jgi:hypothetical protein